MTAPTQAQHSPFLSSLCSTLLLGPQLSRISQSNPSLAYRWAWMESPLQPRSQGIHQDLRSRMLGKTTKRCCGIGVMVQVMGLVGNYGGVGGAYAQTACWNPASEGRRFDLTHSRGTRPSSNPVSSFRTDEETSLVYSTTNSQGLVDPLLLALLPEIRIRFFPYSWGGRIDCGPSARRLTVETHGSTLFPGHTTQLLPTPASLSTMADEGGDQGSWVSLKGGFVVFRNPVYARKGEVIRGLLDSSTLSLELKTWSDDGPPLYLHPF